MELLNPPHRDPIPGPSFRPRVDRPANTQFPESAEETGGFNAGEKDKVFIAVGKSVEKAVNLLQWTLKRFGVGKLPASQANSRVLSAYRKDEKEQLKKLLENYSNFPRKFKVHISIFTIEANQVHKGIVELVKGHGIRNLVMGAIPENCMRMKKSSSKSSYAAKYVPCFCDIWFVDKGKLVWMREASEKPCLSTPVGQAAVTAKSSRSNSLPHRNSDSLVHPDDLRSNSCLSITFAASSTRLTESIVAQTDVSLSPRLSSFSNLSIPSFTNGSERASSEMRLSLDSYSKDEDENLYRQLGEACMEAKASKNEALVESLKCQKLESEAMEAINKIKDLKSAHVHEVKLREKAEESLRATVREREKLIKEKEEAMEELQRTTRNITLLNDCVQEANCKHDEVAGKLKLIQASIVTLREEKQRIRRQKLEAVRWLERWRSRGQAGATTCNGFIGIVEDLPELAEFSLADVQTATCNFSESFKIGKGGHGCVYKGEMLGRTVAIKKLYPHNMQGQSEFQQEVSLFSFSIRTRNYRNLCAFENTLY
ncbi:hypothetical protein V6Z12_D13G275000 [Gossypium hirsutum]